MSKYEPLGHFLRGLGRSEAPLTFHEIEDLLGFKLPESARRHRGWWANEGTTHVQARAWMTAGWQAWEVNLGAEQVLFRRSQRPAIVADINKVDADQSITIRKRDLSLAAQKLLKDYADEAGGSEATAVIRILQEAAIVRRRALIDHFAVTSPRVSGDSTDLVREDRDAR